MSEIEEDITPLAESTPKKAVMTPPRDAFHMTINCTQNSALPILESKPEPYKPMPYMFRIQNNNDSKNIMNQSVRAPPMYINIDHTIAVVWLLFSDEEYGKRLGINQLHWALHVLNVIKVFKGRYLKDVMLCIDTIQQYLIDLYSDLIDSIRIDTPDCSERTPESTDPDADADPEAAEGAEGAEEEGEATGDSTKNSSKLSETPFSYNYADMIERSPPRPPVVIQKQPVCSEGDFKNMGAFLQQWRKDQMRKIMIELDRLNTIENYMGSNGENFEPYLDERDKEISVMLAEKMKDYKK